MSTSSDVAIHQSALNELISTAERVVQLHDKGRLTQSFDSWAIEKLREAIQSAQNITAPKEEAMKELIDAAIDIRDNPGADAHGSVGFRVIELPKLDRLRDALATLET